MGDAAGSVCPFIVGEPEGTRYCSLSVTPTAPTRAAVSTAEPGTTDQRAAHTEWARWLGADDNVITDSPEVFALLRDIADAEPLGNLGGASEAAPICTMCGAMAPRPPVDHLISCPWVRVTQLVGVKPDA